MAASPTRAPSCGRVHVQRRFQRAALGLEVAAAVRRDALAVSPPALLQVVARLHRHLFGAAAGAGEDDGADVVQDQVGEQIRGLGGGGAADRRSAFADERRQGRFPEGEHQGAARGGVVGDRGDLDAGEPGGGHGRVGGRGRGQYERRTGAVARADAAQPAQDRRDVGAEDTFIGVALVDDDIAQFAQERRPARVARQQRVVQHVRIAQDVVRVLTYPVARLGVRVAVQQARADPRYVQTSETSELVRGQRFRRRQIQRGAGVLADRGQRRQLEAHGLAGGGAGGERHMPPLACRLGRRDLVPPGPVHAAALAEAAHHCLVGPLGPLGVLGVPGRDHAHMRHTLRARRGNRDQPLQRWLGRLTRTATEPSCDGSIRRRVRCGHTARAGVLLVRRSRRHRRPVSDTTPTRHDHPATRCPRHPLARDQPGARRGTIRGHLARIVAECHSEVIDCAQALTRVKLYFVLPRTHLFSPPPRREGTDFGGRQWT